MIKVRLSFKVQVATRYIGALTPLIGSPLITSLGQSPGMQDKLNYLYGLGNHHQSEALPGALPMGQNTPQRCPYGLYAEQLSGTAFTAPRLQNQHVWMYRILPAVAHHPFKPYKTASSKATPDVDGEEVVSPNQLRWDPFAGPAPTTHQDWVDGLALVAHAGDPSSHHGVGIFIYTANEAMGNRAFYNSDGDMLIVPEQGGILVTTEFGLLQVEQNEICVVQRGIRFKVDPLVPSREKWIRGYILEVYNGHFELPELGPIGANGLANPHDFASPTAHFQHDTTTSWTIINKYLAKFYEAQQDHTPFDVVAWRGNYIPFKYDLRKFCTINSVSYDHMDPSIFTALTCRGPSPGVAIADFVIFPPRWTVTENTFRPPYYHRNTMTEFMGLIVGSYEAKHEGFLPGAASLHSAGTPHGPDTPTFEKASNAVLTPERVAEGSMTFMFESCLMLKTTRWAMVESGKLQCDYWKAWADLKPHFTPNSR